MNEPRVPPAGTRATPALSPSRTSRWWLGCALLLALGLHLYRLSEIPRLDIDEGCWTLTAVRTMHHEPPGNLSNYSLPLMRWWAGVTWQLSDGFSLPAVRLSGVLLTVIIVLLATRLYHRWFGPDRWFPLWLATLPFVTVWARQGRAPSYLVLAIINLIILDIVTRERLSSTAKIALLTAAFAVAFAVHPTGLAFAPALITGGALALVRARHVPSRATLIMLALALIVLTLAFFANADYLATYFHGGDLLARCARLSPAKIVLRAAAWLNGLWQLLNPAWAYAALQYPTLPVTLVGSGFAGAVILGSFTFISVLWRRQMLERHLLVLLVTGQLFVTAIIIASTWLGYRWAFEDPQMQRFLVCLSPFWFMLVYRSLRLLPSRPGRAVFIMFAIICAAGHVATLVPGTTDEITARDQLAAYRAEARWLDEHPAVPVVTDSWDAWVWLSVFTTPPRTITLLVDPGPAEGYVLRFFEAMAIPRATLDENYTAAPGRYLLQPASPLLRSGTIGNAQLAIPAADPRRQVLAATVTTGTIVVAP